MRMMASPTLNQNRLDWITKELKVKIHPANSTTQQLNNSTDLVYFVGCLPYFDAFFTNLRLNTLNIAKSTIKILNQLGIEPVLMPNERCCGHDLLWTGDIESFKKLAQHNIDGIKCTGAKKIVFSCPEGYQTFKREYPKYIGPLGCEVIHISELIAERLPELKFRNPRPKTRKAKKVTFQDPCSLGRICGIYEQPREIINAMGVELTEMPKNRENAICCGTSGWMNCGIYSKQIQLSRLKQAKSTGADLLITGCPKCQIHFKCAMNDENTPHEAKIEIQDLTSLIASQLSMDG
jgi:Fe-S oxidoreductase